jgi:sucrose phosphorylase
VAHAALTGDTTELVGWAAGIDDWGGHEQSFLNFLASHDGIGMRPAEGLLDDGDIENLVAACRSVGGRISYRDTAEGPRPYELNTTWFDLMSHDVDEDTAIARHLATHAVLLALPGVAGIYVHSLFGSSNDQAGFDATGHNRSLNRARFINADRFLAAALGDSTGRAARVYHGMQDLIARRQANPAYHPEASSQVATLTGRDIVIKRQRGEHVGLCMVNFSDTKIGLRPPWGRPRVLPPWHVVLE